MSIVNRVLFGFAALVLLMVGLGAYALQQLDVVRGATETIVSRDLAVLRQLHAGQTSQERMRELRAAAVIRYLAAGQRSEAPGEDPLSAWPRHAAATQAALVDGQAAVRLFAAEALSADRGAVWQRIAQDLTQAEGILRQITVQTEAQFQAIRTGDTAAVLASNAALAPSNAAFERRMQSATEALNQGIVAGQQRVTAIYEDSRISVAGVLGLAVLIAVVLALLIRRSIRRPLGELTAFMERVGRGDLSPGTAAVTNDELGRLGVALNAMVEGLRLLAGQSREATENLNAAAAEIRASTQQQAASVEEQLAAVQETAATVDEITHAGTQIGKRAQEVIASAQSTAQVSASGLRAVDDTARAMDAIREQAEAVARNIVALSEKTQAIGEITSTVNDISERSHLLALNAALEAASAGEHGRSFAVVAAEMKTLADQAKEATAQVRAILGDIQRGINTSVMLTEEAVKRVAAGKERTDTTQSTINEITGRIQESVQTFQQIVASTNQQQLGIEQVMAALQNIRLASQQTAAGTRQLDGAAANLAGLSQQLVTLTDRYQL
ncbi:MAG TPA: methyl-accepting chemotaxis protein [Falsiroseomonas sp.]|nr:methyl-accepting chemotaxis protein [Falsiroseomonas sp.]